MPGPDVTGPDLTGIDMIGTDVTGIDMIGPLPAFLRQAKDEVTLIAAPTGDEIWLVSDYQLARQVLTDKRFSRSEAVKPDVPKFSDTQPVAQSVMSMDGSEHARLRRIIASQLSPRRAAELVPLIEELTDSYLDRLAAHGPPADLVELLATPLPLAVLGRLLGVPDEDIGQFKDRVAVLFDISASRPKGTARSRIELARYMTYLTDYKRQHPGDDLLSTLISAHDRGELSKSEMITMGLALLAAGFETTAGQIGLMVMVMLADRRIYQKLPSQPEILPVVIDEILRLSPVAPMSFTRAALERVQLGRVVIEPGQAIAVSLFQANRDDKAFAKPDELTLEARAWPQLAFGYGSHRCPGAHLARTQLSVVLARLAQRFPALRLAAVPDPVSWKQGIATRGPSRLMVTW